MKKGINKFRILTLLLSFFTITSSFSQQKTITDPEIAHIAVTANQIDVDYADIALKKSTNKDVKEFATAMKRDHKGVIDQATALVKKLGVTPKDNAISQALMQAAEKTRNDLKAKSKADFDKAYVDNEVSYHKSVIDTVKNLLIPEAKNAELKTLLETVAPILEAHLGHAQMVQRNLSQK